MFVIHGGAAAAVCECGRYLVWALIGHVHFAVDGFPRELLPPHADEHGCWTSERFEARCKCGATHLGAP